MRVAVAGFLHESNTFADTVCRRADFVAADFHRGWELVEHWGDAHHELGGMIAGLDERGVEIVPLLAASATPSGPLEREAYESIVDEIIAELRSCDPVDGVLLALHGSMFTPGIASADGETTRRVREAIGPNVPMVLTLDMHANLSDAMATVPEVTIAYRTYPHIDQRERGIEAAQHMSWMLEHRCRPSQVMIKLPLLIHIVRQHTGDGAMKQLMALVDEVAARPAILSASLAPGYIYADVPDMGVSVIVASKGSLAQAEEAAWEIACLALELCEELNAGLPPPDVAVAQAARIEGLVSLMDCGDNIGGGGPGDSTVLLEEVFRQGLVSVGAILYDPAMAAKCHEIGVGGHVSIVVGGRESSPYGKPVPISGVILQVDDGRYTENEPRHGGHRFFNQGLCAVVRTNEGHLILLNSLRVMPSSLEQWNSVGVDLRDLKAVIVKGATAPLAAYGPISASVIAVDSPGVTAAGPESFVYRNRPRPLFPLDRGFLPTRSDCRVIRSGDRMTTDTGSIRP